MSEPSETTPEPEDDARLLERFVLDNPDLERLESILDDFNPFVALRWTRQEVRHSQFLRWVLDPAETHGLGAHFLRMFVKRVAAKATGVANAPSVVEADSWEYSGTVVLTEWNSIDVLVRSDDIGFVLVIENKVDTAEHSDQLRRYRELVQGQFPDYRQLFVYLTIEGDPPSDECFVALTHLEVAEWIEELLGRRADQIGPDVRTFMAQYVEMLRRHIVQDSEIQELCQRIYRTHRRALEVIFEHRPDRILEVSSALREVVASWLDLMLEHSTKAYVRFWPSALDFFPRSGTGWPKTGRLVLFEVDLSAGSVAVKLVLGPGPAAHRAMFAECVKRHPEVFSRARTRVPEQWWTAHSEALVSASRFKSMEIDELKGLVRDKLAQFLERELPAMVEALRELEGTDWPDES